MIELYENIREEVKEIADTAWRLALAQKNPVSAASFLNNTTNYYKHIFTEEEIEFLQFYFNMKLEMMKNG